MKKHSFFEMWPGPPFQINLHLRKCVPALDAMTTLTVSGSSTTHPPLRCLKISSWRCARHILQSEFKNASFFLNPKLLENIKIFEKFLFFRKFWNFIRGTLAFSNSGHSSSPAACDGHQKQRETENASKKFQTPKDTHNCVETCQWRPAVPFRVFFCTNRRPYFSKAAEY